MKTHTVLLRSVAAVVLACFATEKIHAGIMSSVTPDGLGGYVYTYQVDNTPGTFPVAAWSLEFPGPMDWDPNDLAIGGGVQVPAGWAAGAGIPLYGASSQDFYSLSPASDVAAGAVLGDFSFTSTLSPGNVTYLLYGASGESLAGTTLGPTVPDGGPGLVLSFVALVTVLGLARRSSFQGSSNLASPST